MKPIDQIRAAIDDDQVRVDFDNLIAATMQAYGSLVGATAADDSVQGEARIRLRAALIKIGELP
jgi:hypothetical protein